MEETNGRPPKYMLRDLGLGESRLFSADRNHVQQAVSRLNRTSGMRFTVRATNKGIRVERVA